MSFVSIGAAIRKCTGLSCLRNRRFAIKALAAFGAHVRICAEFLCLQGRRITVNASRALLTGAVAEN